MGRRRGPLQPRHARPPPQPDPAADELHRRASQLAQLVDANAMHGADDVGGYYHSIYELWKMQAHRRDELYQANDSWWDDSGYGGATDEAAMIGDDGSETDLAESCAFLDGLMERHPSLRLGVALDAGAGVGRVTKGCLLRRCHEVHLLEACEAWSKQSRRYLGRKRSERCTFVNRRLEDFGAPSGTYDLIWAQWVFQYLTDVDAVRALESLGRSLSPTGLMVLKENYPYWLPRNERYCAFAIDLPEGEHGRYDVTRPDSHHRILFHAARLQVVEVKRGDETVTWVLKPAKECGDQHSLGRAGAEARAKPASARCVVGVKPVDAAAVLLGALSLRDDRAKELEEKWQRRSNVKGGAEFGAGGSSRIDNEIRGEEDNAPDSNAQSLSESADSVNISTVDES